MAKGASVGLVIGLVAGGVTLVLAVACGVGGIIYYRHTHSAAAAAADHGDISGLINYRVSNPSAVASREHREGDISYPMTPPAGGPHNPVWQNCMGNIYTAPVQKEKAVHSLEHGAVWLTYRPGLAESDVANLARRVSGQPYLFLSPFPGQDHPVYLQAWGYQLALDRTDDPRIDRFIQLYRLSASMEPSAPCSGGEDGTA